MLTTLFDFGKTLERLFGYNGDIRKECIPMTVLETKDLKKYYGSGDTQVKALDGVDLTVENGEFVAIVGTSGSGKSTLLHMLGGLDRPTGGSVLVEGRDIFALKDEELTIFRRRKIVSASSFKEKISFPATVTEPPVGRSRPPSMWSKVDLPEPDVPTMATNSPSSTLRLTPSRAFTSVSLLP